MPPDLLRRRLLERGRAPALALLLAPTGLLGLGATPALAQGTPATGMELAGVRFAPGTQVAGTPLLLNGAGLRYRFVVRVYAAGLYLQSPAGTPAAVLAMPGPKRLHVHMLREIDANELGRLFARGMQDNAIAGEFSKSVPGTLRMGEMFSARKRLRAGESFTVDFVPGVGTQVLINGRPEGAPIREPEFFTALLRIWLGERPADEALKEALLGRAPPPAVTGQN